MTSKIMYLERVHDGYRSLCERQPSYGNEHHNMSFGGSEIDPTRPSPSVQQGKPSSNVRANEQTEVAWSKTFFREIRKLKDIEKKNETYLSTFMKEMAKYYINRDLKSKTRPNHRVNSMFGSNQGTSVMDNSLMSGSVSPNPRTCTAELSQYTYENRAAAMYSTARDGSTPLPDYVYSSKAPALPGAKGQARHGGAMTDDEESAVDHLNQSSFDRSAPHSQSRGKSGKSAGNMKKKPNKVLDPNFSSKNKHGGPGASTKV